MPAPLFLQCSVSYYPIVLLLLWGEDIRARQSFNFCDGSAIFWAEGPIQCFDKLFHLHFLCDFRCNLGHRWDECKGHNVCFIFSCVSHCAFLLGLFFAFTLSLGEIRFRAVCRMLNKWHGFICQRLRPCGIAFFVSCFSCCFKLLNFICGSLLNEKLQFQRL